MPESTPSPLCAVCSDPVDPEEAHWLHESDCPKRDSHRRVDYCLCDQLVHPECCPEPGCQEPAT
jgi:hypothetical protein